jgi:hypothetical protein
MIATCSQSPTSGFHSCPANDDNDDEGEEDDMFTKANHASLSRDFLRHTLHNQPLVKKSMHQGVAVFPASESPLTFSKFYV